MKSVKNLIAALVLMMGSLFTLPAYAWPDVDHMNMCGAPAKVLRTYAGEHRGWQSRDLYIARLTPEYYYRTMCPDVKALKMKKTAYKHKKRSRKIYKKKLMSKAAIKRKLAKKSIRRISKRAYDKKLDCKLVDDMNAYGAAVRVIRRR